MVFPEQNLALCQGEKWETGIMSHVSTPSGKGGLGRWGRREDNLSELSVVTRTREDTEGKNPKIEDAVYFTILPGASFDLFL